jgi:Zn finger protein HypA/HybF involved in hydrogenase expression
MLSTQSGTESANRLMIITPTKEMVRRPWSESDKRRLIAYWDSIGSVVLISILLDRPEGSVQTEASRLNLPRRTEDRGRHRKKWSLEEADDLIRTVESCKEESGKIRIVEVARKIGRSIDAVISRLEDHYGSRDELKHSIVVTEAEIAAFSVSPAPRSTEAAGPNGHIDSRKISMMRTCLSCQKPFWSTGAGNRICPKCKNNDSSDWD